MTTALDVVTQAMRNLNLIALDGTPDAGEGQWALDHLNGMALAWDAQGIHTGWATVALSDEFPLDDRHKSGVVYMLMERLSKGPLSGAEKAMAERGYANLAADYKTVEPMRLDDGLLNGIPPGSWNWTQG